MESFLTTQPIYLQIIEMIKRQIATAVLQPGQPLQPVRELALELQVNPNTVQRALSELERDGYVRSERTIGRYVTDDIGLINALHTSLFNEATDHYLASVRQLHVSDDDVIATVSRRLKGTTHD